MFRFYVLEGADGSGKSSITNLLAQTLRAKIFNTPSDEYHPIKAYVDEQAPTMSSILYYVSGIIDQSEKIKKALQKSHVVCHRWIGSTIVYHSVLRNESLRTVETIVAHYRRFFFSPNLTILLMIDPEQAVKRIVSRKKRRGRTDMISLQNKRFIKRINDAYVELSKREENWIIIDTTNKTVKSVFEEVMSGIATFKRKPLSIK
jgi:dTMP kinase